MVRKIRKCQISQVESYLFEIADISPHYSFHVANKPLEPGAFGEHFHIELTANCLRPKKFEGRTTAFVFICTREVIRDLEAV